MDGLGGCEVINVKCEVRSYERNGEEIYGEKDDVLVESHWNREAFVVISIRGRRSLKLTVLAQDLKAAIENCVNSNA